jgi:hypothetical protein
MNGMQKILFITMIVVIVMACAGGYLLYKKHQRPNPCSNAYTGIECCNGVCIK